MLRSALAASRSTHDLDAVPGSPFPTNFFTRSFAGMTELNLVLPGLRPSSDRTIWRQRNGFGRLANCEDQHFGVL